MLSVLVALALASPLPRFAFADVDITPPESLPLGGYTDRKGEVMADVGDRLHARALALSGSVEREVIVSMETLTIPESLVREVKARLPKDVVLVLCATHTHCAPDSQMLNDRMTIAIPGIAVYRRRWLEWYTERVVSVIKQALAAPGTPFAKLSVKTWQTDVNRGRRKGAQPDKTATILYADDHPLFFEYAAHGTFYDSDENKTRGDWPGAVGQVAPMALIGPIGDVSPRAPGLEKAPASAKIGRFWETVRRNETGAQTREVFPGRLGVSGDISQEIELSKKVPHPEFKPKALGQILVNKFAPDRATITVLHWGTLAIVAIPGEPTSRIGNAIVAAGHKAGFTDVLVLSHCNGWMGYILSPEDYDAGGYEASLSFYGREEGQVVQDTAIEMVSAAAKQEV